MHKKEVIITAYKDNKVIARTTIFIRPDSKDKDFKRVKQMVKFYRKDNRTTRITVNKITTWQR